MRRSADVARRIAAGCLGLVLLVGSISALSAEAPDAPDAPRPRPVRDRVTQYRLWAMHEVAPAYPPYRFALVNPEQRPMTGPVCLRELRALFVARKRPTEPEGTQRMMLLQWLSILPDAKPDYGKWIGCWPTGAPYYLAWEMHRSSTASEDPGVPPYWYVPWVKKATSPEVCLNLIRRVTKRRRVDLLKWYAVAPDPPPDTEKYIGCMPAGFDPEGWSRK